MERGLGAHSKFRKAHGGGVGGEVSWAEVCFEIWADGPKAELDLAVPAEPRDSCLAELQVLRLTDFSRRCATLWLAKHGRRFSCYKERKDKGGKTLHRYTGSLAAVQAGQRKAFDALTDMRAADVAAKRETRIVFGKQWSRTAIVDAAEARASSAEPGKETRNFAERTAAIRERKRRCRPWSGVGGQLPPVRRRTGTTQGCTNSCAPNIGTQWSSVFAASQDDFSDPIRAVGDTVLQVPIKKRLRASFPVRRA